VAVVAELRAMTTTLVITITLVEMAALALAVVVVQAVRRPTTAALLPLSLGVLGTGPTWQYGLTTVLGALTTTELTAWVAMVAPLVAAVVALITAMLVLVVSAAEAAVPVVITPAHLVFKDQGLAVLVMSLSNGNYHAKMGFTPE
tara:strand:+ start:599 stop:1033 length:435 start_codon:yes stop_codon:yes gene_type:complete